MRITTLLIGIQACFATVLLAGSLKAQNINLDAEQVNVKQVFISIEKQTEVTFIYDEKMLQGLSKISIKATNKPLSDILKNISSQLPLQFKASGTVIGVLRTTSKPKEYASETTNNDLVAPPPIKISGKILDAKGFAVPGVTVAVKETKKQTVTDENGIYNIVSESNQTLIFSYIGYKKQEISINGKEHIDVYLQEDLSPLDEVHIIAYGTTTERLSTGSTSKVTSQDIEEQPVGNPLAALEGRVPGMIVTQSNGVPGSAFKVQVQGQNAFGIGAAAIAAANSTPLFIIDGIPFAPNNNSLGQLPSAAKSLSPFNSINPADIESIEVLKDADATAIYGSRGAYGVILITTKNGKSGKTQVNVNVNSGFSSITRMPDFLNTQQYLSMRREAFKNDGVVPNINTAPDLLLFDTTKYTDWKKVMIGNTAHTIDAETSISGGNETTQFLISGGYHHETTVFPGSEGDNRASFHFSMTHMSPNKKFHSSLTASYSNDSNTILASDLTSEINLPPDYPDLFDSAGNLVWQYKGTSLENSYGNPLAYLKETYQAKTNNLLSNLQLSYLLLPGLTLKTNLGYNTIRTDEFSSIPSYSEDPLYSPLGSAFFGDNSYESYILEPQIEYVKNIFKGKIDILGGGSWQQIINNSTDLTGYNYSSDNLLQSISSAGTISASNQYSKYRYEAYFARINYNYNDRYIIDLTGRRDGSSRFGPGRQFANFGAIGAAWLFTNEPFIKNNLGFLSFGKLRGSYGITGSDQIGDYQYLDSWSTTTYPYQGVSGLKPTRLDNPDYSWETNSKIAVDLDLGFFKDRLILSADYYRNRSDNHLLSSPLPTQTGFTSVLENFPALVQNRGFEFVLNTKNIVGDNFGWGTSFNITIPQNKLLEFDDVSLSSYSGYVVGQSLSVGKSNQFLGVNPSTGVFQFGTTPVLSPNTDPKLYGGVSNSVHFKNFSLDIFFDFRKQTGLNYLSNLYSIFNQPGGMINEPVAVLKRWQNPGDQTNVEMFTTTSGTPAQLAAAKFGTINTGSYSDASFIRLKTLYLSYRLPPEWMKHLQIANCKVFVQGQNLLTFTNYLGGDPETQNINTLPPLKTLTAGFQINF